MKNKILFTRPYSSQISPIINLIKNDNFFVLGKNYEIYSKSMGSKDKMELSKFNEFKVVICDVNPRNITGFEYPNKDTNPKQKMIQLTHGVWLKQPNNYLYKGNGNISYILSPNHFSTNLYKKMGYNDEEILKYGFFRRKYYDSLDKESLRAKVLKFFPLIGPDSKFTIFAPSWAGEFDAEHIIEIDYSLDYILNKIPNDHVLLVSSHSLMKRPGKKINYVYDEKYNNKVFVIDHDDLGLNGEMLMTVCDFLWTDYSSIIFDFADLKGWENCDWYSPINDEMQKEETRFIYKKSYKNWASGITQMDFNTGFLVENLNYYNKNSLDNSLDEFINFLKDLLKNEN